MTKQDKFLAATVVFIVAGLAALALTGAIQYQHDSKRFQDSHQEQKK